MTPRAGLNSITQAEHDGDAPAGKKVSLYAVEGGTKKRLTTTAVSTKQALDVNVVQTVGGGIDPVGLKNIAATTINPATEDTLALIKAKTDNIPPLGQALATASVPVVLTATQLATLTPPAAITNYAAETGGNLAAAATSLAALDNAVDSNSLNVNLNLAGADVTDTNPVPVASEKASSAGTSTSVSVGSGSTTVLASNSSRKAAIIVNDSDEVIYLKYGSGATANSGIRLNANGGLIREEMYTGIITGICASGSKVVTVTEI